MLKAYDYLGCIDLDAEHGDEDFPYQSCPLCVNATSPADSERIYEGLCLNCAKIIHAVYTHPHHPVCQSAYIPVRDDSTQVLGLIKMKLYNTLETSTHTKYSGSIEIIKDLMRQTPVEFTIIALINSFLITLLVEDRISLNTMSFMVHTARAYDYISLETAQSLNQRVYDLESNGGA